MIWATDSEGLKLILSPEGIGECFANMPDAQNGEIRTTQLLRDYGYDVDVFLTVYHSKDKETKENRRAGKPPEKTQKELEKEAGKVEAPPEITQMETKVETTEGEPESISAETTEGTPQETAGTPAEKTEEPPANPPSKRSITEKVQVAEPSGSNGLKKQDLDVPGDFWRSCSDEDWLGPGSYFGTFVHPYENLFMKSHRHIEDTVLDRLTEWHDGWGYSSYDVCS